MPLFGGKKKEKTPKRKHEAGATGTSSGIEQTEEETGRIKMRLGDNQLVFEDGFWSTEGGGGVNVEGTKMKKHNQQLLEENNLLQYKVELLLDMLAASNADFIALEKEVDAMRTQRTPGKART